MENCLFIFKIEADSYVKMKKLDEAIKIYEDLLERNPDNIVYYRKLEECLNLSTWSIFKQIIIVK